jgi:serine/threonine protein phosphatase 1
MTPPRVTPVQRFADLVGRDRIWAVSAIHAEVRRLEAIHDTIEKRLQPRDGLVYLGNMIGGGADVAETVAELLAFRRAFIARPGTFAADLVYLRGSQEEMWQKLLELQFAHNPREVLAWMLEHGVGPTLAAYGADPQQGLAAARDGAVALTRWTNAVRQAVNAAPGHANLLTALRRAAFTGGNELLFVHAGIDPSRPLTAQHDSFWWGGAGFLDLAQPYAGFRRVIRGFDRHHGGLQVSRYAVSLDRGCGAGGPLICACFDLEGNVVDSFEA